MIRRAACALTLALSLAAIAPPVAAQSEPTRYLPIDSWTMPYIDHLIRAGALRGLDPLTRPLRLADVVRAVNEASASGLGASTISLLEMLRRELEEPGDAEARLIVEPEIGTLAASDASRWTLRPDTGVPRVFPQLRIPVALELPHFVLATTPTIDNRLKYDTSYTGKQDRIVAARFAQAYVLASWRYADLSFGSVARNWGPSELDGLLISPVPYSREQLAVRLGPPLLRIELLAQALNPLIPWDSTALRGRWLVAHRLVVQPSERLSLTLDESVIAGGEGLPWRFLNPLAIGLMTQTDGGAAANGLLGAAVSWRARGAMRLFGQLMVDDFQVDNSGPGDQEPAGYGVSIGASGAALHGSASWAAYYTRVTNLAYRTPMNEEQYSSDSLGLGRSHADYDQLLARFTTSPLPGLLVGGELGYRRQGEGDYLRRYPPVAAFADSLAFLTGVVERTTTVGAHATWASPHAQATAYLGYNATTNDNHAAGVSRSRWVWRLKASIRTRLILAAFPA